MAEINSLNNTLATAPRSFTNRDRGEELRDGRQQTSQFIEQNEPANDSVDARSESGVTVRGVQGTNATSDANASRRELEVADQQVSERPPVEDPEARRLEGVNVALEQQLQRSNVDRNAVVEAPPREAAPEQNSQQTLASVQNLQQPTGVSEQASANTSQRSDAEASAPSARRDVQSEPSTAEQTNSVQERFIQETAEDALGLNVDTTL